MGFSIVPAETTAASAARPGPLSIDRLHISSDNAVLGKPVVVSAQVVDTGAAAPGATVVFSDGAPQNGGKAFDAEWLPTIRTLDREFVSVDYIPESCGRHEIYADVTGGSNVRPAERIALVDVSIDYQSAIRYLIKQLKDLASPSNNNTGQEHKRDWYGKLMQSDERFDANQNDKGKFYLEKYSDKSNKHKHEYRINEAQIRELIRELKRAKKALDAGRTNKGIFFLNKISSKIRKYKRAGRIDPEEADALIAQLEQIAGCV